MDLGSSPEATRTDSLHVLVLCAFAQRKLDLRCFVFCFLFFFVGQSVLIYLEAGLQRADSFLPLNLVRVQNFLRLLTCSRNIQHFGRYGNIPRAPTPSH